MLLEKTEYSGMMEFDLVKKKKCFNLLVAYEQCLDYRG
jgi:hypothetical protein